MLVILLVLVVVWGIGLVRFVATLPTDARDQVRPEQTDAIVVLTGGGGRLRAGMELLQAGVAPKLLLSGVNHQVDRLEIARLISQDMETFDQALFECCVMLGYGASDTIGNAEEAVSWAKENRFSKLILVTSRYHMPRALLEIGQVAGEVTFEPFAVGGEDVHLEDWYKWPGTAELLAAEWSKLILARIRVFLRELLVQKP